MTMANLLESLHPKRLSEQRKMDQKKKVPTKKWTEPKEVFTLPHVFRAESELSEDSPRTKFGLNSDFFCLNVQPILKIQVRV